MLDSAAWVAERIARLDEPRARPIYGISTGFGALSGQETFHSAYHARVLQRNLLVSHAAGVGTPLPEEVVRAAAFVRVRQLVGGLSGIRIAVVNRLIGVLNAGLVPQVPEMGSLGASGDLAPLAHLALVLSAPPRPGAGEQPLPVDEHDPWLLAPASGAARSKQAVGDRHVPTDSEQASGFRRVRASEALAPLGGRVELVAKEALALTNGASFSAAETILAASDLERILDHAELALAMSLEASRGFRDAFLPDIHAARDMPGQARTARRVLAYTAGSTLLDPASRETSPQRVPPQDAYSLRCAPQVLGAVRDALDWIRGTLRRELNAAVDNPLIILGLPREDKTVSGGNFHGAPVGYAADLLKIVATDLGSISERRTYRLLDLHARDPQRSALDLPMFLVPPEAGQRGLNSGLMIPQYTAASLVSACKSMSHPDSVDSIPSSAGQEDHVAMSLNAAHHARRIVGFVGSVVAIELLTAAQALYLRRDDGHPGAGVAAALERLRADVPPLTFDRLQHRDIESVTQLVRDGELLAAARAASGLPGHGAGALSGA